MGFKRITAISFLFITSIILFVVIQLVLVSPMQEVVKYGQPANCTILNKTMKSNCGGHSRYCRKGFLCVLSVNYSDSQGFQHFATAKTPYNRFHEQKTLDDAEERKDCKNFVVGNTYACYFDIRNPSIVYMSNAVLPGYYSFFVFPSLFFCFACVGIYLEFTKSRQSFFEFFFGFCCKFRCRKKPHQIHIIMPYLVSEPQMARIAIGHTTIQTPDSFGHLHQQHEQQQHQQHQQPPPGQAQSPSQATTDPPSPTQSQQTSHLQGPQSQPQSHRTVLDIDGEFGDRNHDSNT